MENNNTYVQLPNDEYEVVTSDQYCTEEWLSTLQEKLIGKSWGSHHKIESVRFEPIINTTRGNIIHRCVPLWKEVHNVTK